jgi:hypothetical protein
MWGGNSMSLTAAPAWQYPTANNNYNCPRYVLGRRRYSPFRYQHVVELLRDRMIQNCGPAFLRLNTTTVMYARNQVRDGEGRSNNSTSNSNAICRLRCCSLLAALRTAWTVLITGGHIIIADSLRSDLRLFWLDAWMFRPPVA